MYYVHVSICAFKSVVFNHFSSIAHLQELCLKIASPPMISALAKILF